MPTYVSPPRPSLAEPHGRPGKSALQAGRCLTVAALADIHPAIPTIIFAVMGITSGALTFMLPETKDREISETLDDVEK